MAVLVEIRNNGEIAQTNIPLSAIVSGAFTQTLNSTYPGPLAPGAVDTVVVGTMNTFAGGYIDVLTYSNLSNDQNRINDTLALDSILLLPGEPTLLSGFACGNADSIDLEMQSFPGAQYTWWDAPVAGNQLASGDIFRVPTANPGPYYVEYQTGVSGSLTTTLAGGSGCGAGNMFDLIPSSTLAISGFDIVPFATSPTHAVEIYMVVGSHTATSTQADWTLVHTTTVNATANVPVNVTLPNPVQLNANQTYGFYVLHNASYTATANTFNNADLSFISGNGNCTAFDYCCTPRTFNGVIYYESAGCAGPRVPITGTVFTDTASADFTYTETSPGQFSFDATTSTGVQFDWNFGDGNTGTGISTSHVYTQGGNYTVTLVVTDTVCASVDSMVQTINTTVSAEDLLIQESLRVFPNPSTGIFNVVFEMEGTRDLNLRVLNATGQVILDESAGRFSGEFRTNIDLSGFANGIYLLQIQTEKGVATRRLSLM
jgi:PKD repeat protein